ncbi:MAG: PTS sugar transporter subunit IIA [Candidatus Rhabdochlamydia sp.]
MAILARINHQISLGFSDLRKLFKRDNVLAISDYLDEDLVLFMQADNRDDALNRLVNLLEEKKKLQDPKRFYQAILEREKIVPTAIGLGVAVPHAKLHSYKDFFIAIGIQVQQGLEWNALDGMPVQLIFMIGGPDNRQTEYLRILSHLTMAIKNKERRKQLLECHCTKKVIELFNAMLNDEEAHGSYN